jgi:hypothetical protein
MSKANDDPALPARPQIRTGFLTRSGVNDDFLHESVRLPLRLIIFLKDWTICHNKRLRRLNHTPATMG